MKSQMKRMTRVLTGVAILLTLSVAAYAGDCCNGSACCKSKVCCKAKK